MLEHNAVLRHSHGLSNDCELTDGLVVQQDDRLHTLNETAREIFEMFDGSRSVGDVIDDFEARFPDIDNIREIVINFISRLYETGLLTE